MSSLGRPDTPRTKKRENATQKQKDQPVFTVRNMTKRHKK